MKKITLFITILVSSLGFSQSNTEKIQNYLTSNASKNKLSSQDTKDWILENTTSSETTGIENCLVKQSYRGIEIQQSYVYFWIKNGEIINSPEGFIPNVASKINTTTPSLSVTEGFSRALTQLGEKPISTSVIEGNKTKFKLSNGVLQDDPVNAKLVYYMTNDKALKLAWSYEFYTQNTNHLWNVQIDAQNGTLLEKRDLVLHCNFKSNNHSNHNHTNEMASNGFYQNFFKQEKTAFLTPGTTTYKVVPFNYESPNHYKVAFPASTDGRTTITNPEAATVLAPLTVAASPNGWHNASTTIGASTTTYAYTRGNNVFAYSDYTNANPANPTTYANASAGTYPSLTFDHAYGGNGVTPTTYINAAITNLFYMNNIMHDIWYQYGFNEANRNFQAANYGRGGSQGDAVNAEAQDASQATTPSFNNANFSTPADGSKPRMQMYLWNVRKNSDLHVNTGSLAGTDYKVNDNAFSPGHVNLPIAPSVLTGTLMLVNDGSTSPTGTATTGSTDDACQTIPAGSLTGKIAVIRRGGGCAFALKVKNAQTAGAIAVIVVNNDSANPTARISMAGADATITIPAVSMTYADGEALIASLSSGTITVNLSSPEIFVNADGDFDNGIISHEYGHGISTRLVGGGGGLNSAEQPGEGWSDWFALMLQIKPGDTRNDAKGIGTYAMNQPTNGPGIREFMYSTNMAVNPHTYIDTNDQWYTDANGIDQIDVHGVGSIWCAMLWDLAWNYIDKYGYSSNIYNGTGGNNKVMKLVIDALKLTPANPSFIQCRDAIIAADQATTGGQDFCMIWATFARRGLGTGASAGGNTFTVPNIQDQVQSFTEPAPGPNCTLAVNQFENDNLISVYPNPSNGQINIQISKIGGNANLEVVDLNGRIVYSQKDVDFSSEKTINLTSLQAGMYIVKIKGGEINFAKKIIIN